MLLLKKKTSRQIINECLLYGECYRKDWSDEVTFSFSKQIMTALVNLSLNQLFAG